MIEVQGLHVHFGTHAAVQDVSFALQKGECFGLVGESGSGKSTVLRAICGLNKPSSGDIRIHDDGRPLSRRVQMVFQDPYGSLHPGQTLDRILSEPLAIHGIAGADARIQAMLDAVGLAAKLRFRYPHQLSGGQRQRVAIARALMLEPSLLLLDEPTSALDASVQAEILNLLDALKRERQLSYLMVSHDLAVVAHLCERVMVMKRGREVEALTTTDLAAGRATQAYTQELLKAAQG